MSNKELNRKLAELLGWTEIEDLLGYIYGSPPGSSGRSVQIPDYCGDLNAVHEAEKALSNEPYSYRFGLATYSSSPRSDYYQLLMFGRQPSRLYDGCGKYDDMPNPPPPLPHLAGGLCATARQRTEALIKTLEEKQFRAISFSPGKSESDPIKETFGKL